MIVFGASVTAQKNGYSRLINNTKTYGYGGYHLRGGGVAFLSDIDFSQNNTNIALIDWFSTGDIVFDDNFTLAINAVISKFESENITPICLLLPNKAKNKRLPYVKKCKDYFNEKNIQFIDVEKKIEEDGLNLNDVLRDNVHTTVKGAKIYADIIIEHLHHIDTKLKTKCSSNKFNAIKSLNINKVYKKELVLKGNAEIIGLNLEVGPHSGIVIVNYEGGERIENTYDQWCHYYRYHMNFSGITFDNSLNFSIAGLLNVKNIYYIGDISSVAGEEYSWKLYSTIKKFKETYGELVRIKKKLLAYLL